ncbi:MAG: SCO family protein [Acidimicrobiales bacterium]|jgi:cytochrome oxidase Cu insertion factor (SCO1/SenC/PrrC family)
MGTFLQTKNPVVVSAFHTALLHQVFVIGLVLLVVSLAWNVVRTSQYRRAVASGAVAALRTPVGAAEPLARRVLRVGFGLLWLLDGLLQLQAGMPLGLPGSVVQPSADASPAWVQHVVNVGVTIWSDHPVQAAASVVWIQLGLGAFLLLAPRGRWSCFAGVTSLSWGLVVWVFGEGFGGVFGHGPSWLFGTPGAALLYCVAGALVALPESAWTGPRLGRIMARCTGAFLLGMALLEAWPGRGSWQGSSPRAPTGTLTTMVRQMAQTSQPGPLATLLRAFGRFDAAHGFAVNLVVVVVLAGTGVAFCVADRRVLLPATVAVVVLCAADWVLVQDLGFFGGVGTDPNSMVPTIVLVTAAYLAFARAGARAVVVEPTVAEPAVAAVAGGGRPWWDRLTPGYLNRLAAGTAAMGIVLVGAIPMAAASVNPHADPILAEAVDGTPDITNVAAPAFDLVDQRGRPVSLSSLRGRTIALTFLDPVCTSDCPVIAQAFHAADTLLGADARKVVFAAVVANPIYRAVSFTDAFDRQEGLERVPNWLFLTGSLPSLQAVWARYGVEVDVSGGGAMVDHSDLAYLIDADGHTREVLSADPGDGTAAHSSFSVYLANALEHVITP